MGSSLDAHFGLLKTISIRTWQKGGGFSSVPTPKPPSDAQEPVLRSIPLSRCQMELESRLLYWLNACQISHTGVKWQLAIYLSWFLLPAVSQLSVGLQVAFLGGCSSMGGHQLQEAEGWGQLLTLHGMGKDGHTQLEVHCMENSQTLPFQYFCSPPWCRHFCALQLRCFFHPIPTGLVSSRKFIRQMMNNMDNQQLESSSISFESWSWLRFVF